MTEVKEAGFAAEFIAASPNFWDDIKLENIDAKHREILEQVAQLNVDSFKLASRQWNMQTDLGSNAQFSISKGLKRGIIRPIYRKFFRPLDEACIRSSLLDDIDIIKLIGAGEMLKNNPVHKTPGVVDYSFHDGVSVNIRWLRYIYLAHRLIERNLLNNGIWVDIGSFYGGLQGLVHKYEPGNLKILVDFHHQLLRSYVYLKKQFPDEIHVLPNKISKEFLRNDLPKRGFLYC